MNDRFNATTGSSARRSEVHPGTEGPHTKHIFTKLDVTNRRAAVRRARQRGLL
jgi:LuxR family maltose regulon positive regulatory protein